MKINTINQSDPIQEEKENTDRVLNLEAFTKFSGNDREALIRILTSLADNLQSTMESMQMAFESSDYQKLALLSHRMLPNIRNLGAIEEASLLQKLEALRTSETFDHKTIGSLLQTLKKGITQLESALRNEIGNY